MSSLPYPLGQPWLSIHFSLNSPVEKVCDRTSAIRQYSTAQIR